MISNPDFDLVQSTPEQYIDFALEMGRVLSVKTKKYNDAHEDLNPNVDIKSVDIESTDGDGTVNNPF